ncbi:hypothetical protein Pyrfu_1799 [Pyrolobus fumarii 1A]|uniref:DUF6036 domain-containing protein n=1 Tax=Pyrolobus fumarii (strain DSM 11204 / 1A) TaxID=694429 RepID=G0ECT3_PYRF1|nr:DUF6036 family nucleotidyltransferase [Pyrolobus fumarii]AEM39653.1 hypothetical protein Pyrfu_1799 [Pyrolobus fumarii 1A]
MTATEESKVKSLDAIVERLARELREHVAPILARIVRATERFLYFLAWLNTRLEETGLGRIIIVGGFAVEVYTGAAYQTYDVDLIVEGADATRVVERLLKELGELGLRTYHLALEALAAKAIDIVGSMYPSRGRRPPVTVRVNGYRVYIEPPEDLIVKYLVAWRWWKSRIDRDKALAVAAALYEKLDWEYIRRRAAEERVVDEVDQLQREAREVIESSTSG